MIDSKHPSEGHAFTPQQQKMLEQVSEAAPSKLNHFRKAFARRSLRSAITAKCLECVSYEAAEVRRCTASGCPLYEVRPYQEARPHRNTEKTQKHSERVEVNNDGNQG